MVLTRERFAAMNNLPCSVLVEFLGTLIFFTVILRFASKEWCAFPIGLALTAAILFGGAVSGGHFNPAVSFMMLLANKSSLETTLAYVIAQLCAAWTALFLVKHCSPSS